MYVLGGVKQYEGRPDETVNSVLKFDCRMHTWSEVAPMPEERDNAGACVLCNDVYIFGGLTENGVMSSTTYRISTETNEWATLAPMPEAKSHHIVSLLDGLMYVMGGLDSEAEHSGSVHRFDPVAILWSAVAPMSVARSTLGSFVLGGTLYSVGGHSGGEGLSSMERYCVAENRWRAVIGGELSTARECLGALVVRLEVDLFDSLITNAKSEKL
jgi:N-acetylneuraminic acid mutarotase